MMDWNSEEKKQYDSLILGQMRNGCVILCNLFFTILTAFTIIDYLTQQQFLQDILTIRFITIAVFAFLYVLIRKGKHRRHPMLYSVLMLAGASTSMTAMCIVQGGFAGPYYFGVVLIGLTSVLVLPIGPKVMAKICFVVFGIYVFGVGLISGIGANIEQAMHNVFSLFATGTIGITAANVMEKLRRESFDRNLQLEKAQLELQRSRDLLQVELQSKQDNIETLIQEITHRKVDLEKALKTTQEAKTEVQTALNLRDEFISLASHELNTPLTSLKLQTQLAQRQYSAHKTIDTNLIEKMFETYDFQLKRLIRTVNDMLDISRIRQGKLELERSEVNLGILLKQLVEFVAGSEANIRIDCKKEILGKWDQFRLEQAIVNLLTNALKYGAGKPIEIMALESEGRIHIQIKDNGIGIAPENLTKIFNPFERAVTSKEYPGLGLGLYITKHIIEGHGGSLKVESELNRGATFVISLPGNVA